MAAGLATRMGRDKLALPWDKTTVLGHVVETVFGSLELVDEPSWGLFSVAAFVEIYVVSRKPIEVYLTEKEIQRFKAYGAKWIQIPEPRPLAETLHASLQDLDRDIEMIGFLPGDQVGVTSRVLASCLRRVLEIVPDFLVPFAGETSGSPVFFHRRYVSELLNLRGEQGGRVVLYRYPERWRRFTVDENFFQDVDTPEQYQALLVKDENGTSLKFIT
jgi:molybdenum cofactor cytidylyltransferase